jgi:cation:H+ antiporter
LSFKVGVTSDILDAKGEPVFGREPLKALDAAPGLEWEWLPKGIREITTEHAAKYDALYVNSPKVPAAAVAAKDLRLKVVSRHVLGRDLVIDGTEGLFFVACLVAFIAYAVWIGRKAVTSLERQAFQEEEEVHTASFGRSGGAAVALNVGAGIVGAGLLAGGSTALVKGAVGIASALGVSDAVIGLTIVSAGTSAPELISSIVAARRGRDDIAVANIIGSCIFNVLGIAGVTAMVLPLPIPPEIQSRDNHWMLGFSLLLLPLMRSGMRITRAEGGLLFGGYTVYVGLLIRDAVQAS